MAIVKASFTKSGKGAKAAIRYIAHRPGKEGARITRTLFGVDGVMERTEAYRMIDDSQQGSVFFRLVISPDPRSEDSEHDLYLRAITAYTLQHLEDCLQTTISWVAVEHADHAPHRHVHVVAVVQGRLSVQDFAALRQAATAACREQRQERDLTRAHQQQEQEAAWEAGY